ncbi:MAG: acyltransferase [Acetobacteraceae bacterium]|nr:acyltransferase [Acetobacteraceae bacterium]
MRYPALDALRGIAAFAVVTHHAVLAGLLPVPPGAWTTLSRYTPLHLFVNGRASVILFFVLSGFVLTMSLEGERPGLDGWLRFAGRRLCRIYLPYAVAILVTASLSAATTSRAPLPGGWAARLWSQPATPDLVARHLLMPIAWADLTLDRVAWSLVHEIRISFLFPLLLAAARAPVLLVAGCLAASALGYAGSDCASLACLPYNGSTTLQSFAATMFFVPFFAVGLLLARHRARIARVVGQAPPAILAAAWIVAIYGLIAPFKFEILPDVGVGAAAALLLSLVLPGGGPARLLDTPPLPWLGRVSFSLYLCHLPVLALVLRIAAGADRSATLGLFLLLSLLAAAVFHRLVEAPCVGLGRRLATGRDRRIGYAGPKVEKTLAWTRCRPAD